MRVRSSSRFEEHTPPPGHPERPERAEVFTRVATAWRDHFGGRIVEARPATREELLRVHDAEYLDALDEVKGRAAMLDEDTFTSPESHEVAVLAAGAGGAGPEQPAGTG